MKKAVLIIAILAAVVAVGVPLFKKYTKSHSPAALASYQKDGLSIKIDYCRPAAKGRMIFGEKSAGALLPYGQYWRAGANEATTFETNTDLVVNGKELKAGKYALYAIPGQATWTIVLNSDWNRWGALAPDAQKDVLRTDVPVNNAAEKKENFEISFENADAAGAVNLDLHWDKSLVRIPLRRK